MTADINEHPPLGPDHQLPPHPSTFSKHRVLWLIAGAILLLLILLLLLMKWRDHEKAKKAAEAAAHPPGTTITTVTAEKGNIGVYLDAIGTVTPVYTDSITSQVNGLVESVHFTEGQRVKKGDPLIDIDARPYQAMLLEAQGALERDENLLAEAQVDLDRYRDAWAHNAIAKQMLDDQEKLVKQYEGTVKNDQGMVQYEQVQVDFCHITAPIDGRMGLRLVDPGNVVQSSGTVTLAVITQLEPITVIFTIPEDSLGQVEARLRQGATLPVDAFDRTAETKLETGHLLTIDNQIDTTTGTVKGRAIFNNKNDALFPNQFVNTRLLVNTLQGVTLVPSSAVQQNGQTSFVYLIQNNLAHVRNVKPGVTDAGKTQVTGINPGDIVANSSFDKLQDNAPVVISNKAAQGHGAGSGKSSDSNSTDGNPTTGSGTP